MSSAKIQVMQKIWIPRSLRWTTSERQAKKIQAKNNREIRLMFWRESQALREQIQKEITQELLVKEKSRWQLDYSSLRRKQNQSK